VEEDKPVPLIVLAIDVGESELIAGFDQGKVSSRLRGNIADCEADAGRDMKKELRSCVKVLGNNGIG
jgi:hypothetical protein